MIKANELRIGNYVADNHGKVINVEYWMLENDDTACEGIPLTEEWLEKFGFHALQNCFKIYYIEGAQVEISIDLRRQWLFIEQVIIKGQIKYVHKLQNVFFALTGEELIVKQPALH